MDRDTQYDLLTAALLGAAVGAGLALLAGGGRSKPSTFGEVLRDASGHTRRLAGQAARGAATRGAKMARDLGDDASDSVRRYAGDAREAIDEAVAREVRELRRAVRRQRKRLGL